MMSQDARARIAAIGLVLAACGTQSTDPPSQRDAVRDAAPANAMDTARVTSGTTVTRAMMQNVHFHLPHDVILRIDYVTGEMRPLREDTPIIFDDIHSFAMNVEAGEIALSMASLERLMNDYVFAYDDAPLRDFEFETKDDRIVLKGTLDALINIGFEVEATPELTPDGEILMRPHRIRTGGTIGTAIRDLFGIDLDEAVDFSGARGVRAEGDQLFLDPATLLPPPRIEGPITEIRLDGAFLVQRFGHEAANTEAQKRIDATLAEDANEMLFTGGQLGFGKLRMIDADMRVIDLDPADPFDFSIVAYNEQLVAGYSRTMSDLGLNVYMPDLDDLRQGRTEPRY